MSSPNSSLKKINWDIFKQQALIAMLFAFILAIGIGALALVSNPASYRYSPSNPITTTVISGVKTLKVINSSTDMIALELASSEVVLLEVFPDTQDIPAPGTTLKVWTAAVPLNQASNGWQTGTSSISFDEETQASYSQEQFQVAKPLFISGWILLGMFILMMALSAFAAYNILMLIQHKNVLSTPSDGHNGHSRLGMRYRGFLFSASHKAKALTPFMLTSLLFSAVLYMHESRAITDQGIYLTMLTGLVVGITVVVAIPVGLFGATMVDSVYKKSYAKSWAQS